MSSVVRTWLCDQDNGTLLYKILRAAGDKNKLRTLCNPDFEESGDSLEDKGWIPIRSEEEISFCSVGAVRMSQVFSEPNVSLIAVTNGQRENLAYILSRCGD